MNKIIKIIICTLVFCLLHLSMGKNQMSIAKEAEPLNQVKNISPPNKLEPTGYFETTHDGTSNFSVSPYYFETNAYISSSLHAQALTNFRIEFYDKDGNFLFSEDAYKDGMIAPDGKSYYVVDRFLYKSDSPTFYYVILNLQGDYTTIQGSTVQVKHKTLASYGEKPPTQLVPNNDFQWSYDGTADYSYSPYYFKNSNRDRVAYGFSAGAKTNFRLEFYDLSHNYLGQLDAGYSSLNLDYPFTISSPDIPGNPEYYYMVLVNMHGDGTLVRGNLMNVKGGN